MISYIDKLKIVLFITTCITLYISYDISFEINSILELNRKCGKSVLESDMLRNKALYLKKWSILWPLIFITIITMALLLFKTYPLNGATNLYLIVGGILLTNIILHGIKFNNIKSYYTDYSEEYKYIKNQINDMFSRSAGGRIFVSEGLNKTFPPEFLNELVSRWTSDDSKYFNMHDEVLYTRTGIIDEIERTLFEKDSKNKIIRIKEGSVDKLLGLLRPIKNSFKLDDEIIQKYELSFIHDAYLKWACKHKSFNEEVSADCDNLLQRLRQLPEITAFNKNALIKSYVNRFLYINWTVFIIIAYNIFISNRISLQNMALFTMFIILLIITYYVLVFRNIV